MSNASSAGSGLSTSYLVLRLVSVSSGRGDDLHTEGGPNPRLLPSANKIFSAPSHGLHGAKVTAVTASRAQKVSWPSGGMGRIDPGGSPDWIKIKNPNAPTATRILEW